MNEHILIVDSDSDIFQMLSNHLAQKYKLHFALNCRVALDILSSKRINLIIGGISISNSNGMDFCKQIKSNVRYCHIPFVLLAEKNTFNEYLKGLKAGIDAYMQQPVSRLMMQYQISNLLRNRLRVKRHLTSLPFQEAQVLACSKADEMLLVNLAAYLKKHMGDVGVHTGKLAKEMNMSRATFYRRIKSITSLSPKDLIEIVRIKKATHLIAQNELHLNEISKMVGYRSQSSFSRNFNKHLKLSPMGYIDTVLQKKELPVNSILDEVWYS